MFSVLHETPGGHAVVEEFEGEDWLDTLDRRRADALRWLAERFLANGWKALDGSSPVDTSADRYQVVVHIDQALLAAARSSDPPFELRGSRPERCELEHGPALALDTARRLACDSTLIGMVDDEDGEPLNVGRKTRAIPAALRRALRARDGGCRFPCCDRKLFTHAHHVIHWADGGETKLSNLITLCSFHHALVHEGGFDIKTTDDGGFVFLDPRGQPLPATGRLSRPTLAALASAAAEERVTLSEIHRRLGLRIDAETAASLWAGDRMDYGMAVGGLITFRDQARERAMAEAVP